jgi:hypothetical protein
MDCVNDLPDDFTPAQRLALGNMLSQQTVLDQTPLIRQLKHSALLRADVAALTELIARRDAGHAPDWEIDSLLLCPFLATYYPDVVRKIATHDIDLNLLALMIDELQRIEDGAADQHMASFRVGTILKNMYIDSVQRQEIHSSSSSSSSSSTKPQKRNITYKQFKKGELR